MGYIDHYYPREDHENTFTITEKNRTRFQKEISSELEKREPVRNIREIFEDISLRDALIRQIYSSRENSHWKISSTEEEIKGEILGWLSRAYISDSASFPPDFDF
jgi:hypothetical protein